MEQIGWTSIVLSVLTLLGGCGWLIDRKKHRQEIESLKADNRQKDMNRRTSERRGQAGLGYPEREGGNAKRNLSRDYVTEWRTYIAEPLQREVGVLRQEVAELRHAIQAINFVFLGRDSAIPKQAWMALAAPSVDVCPHRAQCPVLDELRKQSEGD